MNLAILYISLFSLIKLTEYRKCEGGISKRLPYMLWYWMQEFYNILLHFLPVYSPFYHQFNVTNISFRTFHFLCVSPSFSAVSWEFSPLCVACWWRCRQFWVGVVARADSAAAGWVSQPGASPGTLTHLCFASATREHLAILCWNQDRESVLHQFRLSLVLEKALCPGKILTWWPAGLKLLLNSAIKVWLSYRQTHTGVKLCWKS